jgi:hypothetical protein
MGNVRLASFLVDLATIEEFRERFHRDPVGTLDSLATPLSPEARKAVLEGNAATIFDMLAVNNQNNEALRKPRKPRKPLKKPTKKPTKKPGKRR